MAIMITFPQTLSIPAEHPCPNHDNVQMRLHPFPQSIHVATMMTFPQAVSIPTEHPCGNPDNVPQSPSIPAEHPCPNHLQLIVIIMLVVPRSSAVLLRLSVVACVSSVCAKSDGSRIFGILRSQVCRTGRAKLNLSMRKNPHENAFSLLATLVKRVQTDRRPKNFIFSKPFFATKTTVFCTPTCPKPARKPFLHTYTRKSKIAFSRKKGSISPPPPPAPPPRQVQLCRWERRFRGPNPKKTWDPLRWRDLVVVVAVVVGNIVAVGVGVGVVAVADVIDTVMVLLLLFIFFVLLLLLLLRAGVRRQDLLNASKVGR